VLAEQNQSVNLMRWEWGHVRFSTGEDYRFSRSAMNVFVNDASRWGQQKHRRS
jgi:hypothetical protein